MPTTKYPDKEALKKDLLANGLRLLHDNGYKNTSVDDIRNTVGVSKGIFYSLFPSKEVFALQALVFINDAFLEIEQQEVAKGPQPFAAQYRHIVAAALEREDIFFLRQPEQEEVFGRLSEESRAAYYQQQQRFYEKVLHILGKNTAVCDPAVFGNLIMLHFLTIHSAKNIPVLFEEGMAATIDAMADAVVHYFETH